MKLAFVILNYGTYKETTECVQSIKEHIDVSAEEYNITIVDNGSKDNSLELLRNRYGDIPGIDILEIGENLGFAKGNNAGIAHVNKRYKPEFVVVLNSDIELFQDDLYQKLIEEYKHSRFAVLGPMMLITGGRCDNSPWEPCSRKDIEKKLKQLKKEKRKIENGTILFTKIANKIKEIVCARESVDNIHKRKEFWKYHTQVELQGAFLVFSQETFEHIEGFDDRTFLYYEEELLYLSIMNHGLTMVYDPRIGVYHKYGSATKKIRATFREKMRFINQCNIDSLEILLSEMKNRG